MENYQQQIDYLVQRVIALENADLKKVGEIAELKVDLKVVRECSKAMEKAVFVLQETKNQIVSSLIQEEKERKINSEGNFWSRWFKR